MNHQWRPDHVLSLPTAHPSRTYRGRVRLRASVQTSVSNSRAISAQEYLYLWSLNFTIVRQYGSKLIYNKIRRGNYKLFWFNGYEYLWRNSLAEVGHACLAVIPLPNTTISNMTNTRTNSTCKTIPLYNCTTAKLLMHAVVCTVPSLSLSLYIYTHIFALHPANVH